MEIYPQDHRDYLKNELVRRFQRRPQYSLRAFARDLELSPSTLSDFLNNKLIISDERIRHLAKKISLQSTHQEHWVDLVRMKFSKDKSQVKLAKIRIKERLEQNGGKLSLHRFKTLTTWYYLCIYHLIQISPRFQDLSLCQKALGLTAAQVSSAIQSLSEVGLLKKDNGVYIPQEEYVLVSESTPSEHIRLFHSQFINKALTSVDEQSPKDRELSTCLMTIRKADLDLVRADIQKFADEMMAKYSLNSDADELYCLTTQFFSLTQKENNNE